MTSGSTIFVFHNSTDPRLVALTDDEIGSNLPSGNPKSKSHWIQAGSFSTPVEGMIEHGVSNVAKAREDIERVGYHLFQQGRILRAPHGQSQKSVSLTMAGLVFPALAMFGAQMAWAYDLTPDERAQPDTFVVHTVVASTASLGPAFSVIPPVAYVQNTITEDLHVAMDPAEERAERDGITDVRSGYVTPIWPATKR